MREPNIKALVESLAEEEFIEAVFTSSRDADAEVAQLLYFMKGEQAATLYNEISQLTETKKRKVVASLTRLYPLSKNIIFTLLRKRETTPVGLLKIYDTDCQLLDNIRETLEEIRKNSTTTSIQYNNYLRSIIEEKKEIEDLQEELQALHIVSEEKRRLSENKQQLQQQLAELERDYESGGLENEIKELEQAILELSHKKEDKTKEKKRLEQELHEISESLRHEEDDVTRKFRRTFSELEKCIKSIAEGV